MTKYGALVNGSMSTAQKINIAQRLRINYVRTSLNIGNWVYTPGAYNQYIAAGLGVVVNYNWLPSGGTPQPFRTAAQLADYGAKAAAMLDALALPELVVCENEEINPNYHSGPISDYVGQLATLSPIVHAKGLKLTNGGIYGTGLDMLTFRYIKATYGLSAANAFGALTMTAPQVAAANTPNSNPTLEAKATLVQAVLDASMYLDYINIHPYEVINPSIVDPAPVTTITPGVIAYYQEFILVETGLPTITNETGQRYNSQPALVTAMLNEYDSLLFDYVLWFDGVGEAGAQPLNDQTFPYDLQSNGEAFAAFMDGPTEPPTVNIITPDTVVYLPDNSLNVLADVMSGYLHTITSVLWTKSSGPATYTISNPASANTTFSNLVAGTYVFRLTATQDDAQTAFAEIEIVIAATQEGLKYIIRFKNRQQDDFRVELLPKNYSGVDRELIGADDVFTLKYQSGDGNIYSPIRASEAVIQFITEGNLALTDFYNDDDTFWKVLFYGEKINPQAASDILLWTGFLQIDNSGEEMQNRAHIISLNANDNLGLLKNIALPAPTTSQIYQGILLKDLIAIILKQTSLLLKTNAYLNIFENSTSDRSDSSTIDFLQESAIYTNNLQNSDGTYKNCYDILSDILNTFRAGLCQSLGAWFISRQGEYRLFTNAAVKGTQYDANFTVLGAITLDSEITIGRGLDILPVNEDQIKRVLRPYQYVKKTFNYQQPAQLIVQQDLSLPLGAVPYATSTVSGIRYDKYSLTTYFPYWRRGTGDTSYLEVATDIAQNNEIERYIVTPGHSSVYHGMMFNNIPVTANDSFDFSFQFRAFDNSAPSVTRFFTSFILADTNGKYWYISGIIFAGQSSTDIQWAGPFTSLPPVIGLEVDFPDTFDRSEYYTWSLSGLTTFNGDRLLIPADGILLIDMQASNNIDANPRVDLLWNNIAIQFKNAVNSETTITGQIHNQKQSSLTKNNSQESLNFDDSPLNTISGTLFRTPLVNFASPVGELYFYRTNQWHRTTINEDWRLNQIQTFDELFIQRQLRSIVEGSWFGLRYYTDTEWKYLSMQNILKINFLQSLNFIFGIVEFNYMTGIFSATLYECFDDGEVDSDLHNTYEFKYLYNTK